MTQYTNVGKDPDDGGPASAGEIKDPVISDGGGILGFTSTTEHVNQKRDARIGGAPPFNADQNHEVIRLKGRHKVWQLTNTENCDNGQVSVDDDGRRIVWRSTCDLVPGRTSRIARRSSSGRSREQLGEACGLHGRWLRWLLRLSEARPGLLRAGVRQPDRPPAAPELCREGPLRLIAGALF